MCYLCRLMAIDDPDIVGDGNPAQSSRNPLLLDARRARLHPEGLGG